MKSIIKALLTICLITFAINSLQSSCPAIPTNSTPITITKIYDGDTVQAEVEGEVFLVRLKGVDCYETMRISRAYRQAYEGRISVDEVVKRGERSKEYLSGLFNQVGKDRIYFQFQGVDRYSRALGVLYFGRVNVNEEMINGGGCLVYEYKRYGAGAE